MSQPIPLRNANDHPVQHVVDLLESALAKARSGELREIAMVGSVTGNKTYRAFSSEDIPSLVGLLMVIQHEMLSNMRGSAE